MTLSAAVTAPPSRCRPVREGTSLMEGDFSRLLHQRLRLVTLLALVPGILFFLRALIAPPAHTPFDLEELLFRAALILFQSSVLLLLWPARDWPLCQLRKMELAMIAFPAAFFCWMQFGLFRDPRFFAPSLDPQNFEIVRLWIDSSAVRWFFLITLYGVFIPNTWRRCLLVATILSSLPLIITLGGAWLYADLTGEVIWGAFDLLVLTGTATAVAVFGSYRLELLRKEAFRAQQLGQYRLGARLGAGGMGEVYEAEHVLLRRRCAIKLIRSDQTRDPAILERFEREVQAMAALTHPNTVEVYDYGRTDDGTFYYVMEYLPGLTLEQLVAKHGPIAPGRTIHLLRQVCRALREAHSVGFLHRDIKPSNVIVCERGGEPDVAKLLDFGLVQHTGPGEETRRLTLKGMVLGSPPFMSPEQATGRTDLGATTDVYSIGGVAYFLLTGQPPFVRETPMEMLLAHAYETVESPKGVPADLSGVIMRCLSKKPDDRYPNVVALEEALLKCESAQDWTEGQASAWWRETRHAPETSVMEAPQTGMMVAMSSH